MSWIEMIVLSFGVAMDATAVSLCKGQCVQRHESYKLVVLPFLFGIFQFVMPLLGGFLGEQVTAYLKPYDSLVGGILLAYIGIAMIRSAQNDAEEAESACTYLSWKEMLILAVATSIDALAVGASLAFAKVPLLLVCILMGLITFGCSLVAMGIGRKMGDILQGRGEVVGGIALLLIAGKICFDALR